MDGEMLLILIAADDVAAERGAAAAGPTCATRRLAIQSSDSLISFPLFI